jgi:hypothetical protein
VFPLDSSGGEIAELSAHLDAATARLLTLIREFDAREGYEDASSCRRRSPASVSLDSKQECIAASLGLHACIPVYLRGMT